MGLRPRGMVAAAGLLWLLVVGTVTCGGQEAGEIAEEEAVPEKPIEAVLKEHTDRLMALPGVVGTGQGECAGKPCIKVFVVKETSELLGQIPSAIEGYTVEVVATGKIKARDPG